MTVYNLIEDQFNNNSKSLAISFDNQQFKYDQLKSVTNKLTDYLLSLGVKRGDIVGLCVNRSIEMVGALIAIIKIGATYLPLDPAFPSARLKFMLEDSNSPYLITERSMFNSFNYFKGQLIDIKDYVHRSADKIETESVDENSVAYIIYTSGSTGNPKGVQITHRSLVNFLLSMKKLPGLSSEDSFLAVTTLSFDISGLEIFLPLITGAKLIIASKEEAQDGRLLLEKLKKVTVMQATPSTWKMLIDTGWNAKLNIKALCGGEALTRDLADKLLERVDSLWNMYGPTETTIWSSVAKVEPVGTIHLGRPIDNTQFYIVDKNNQFCAPGVAGELLISGDGLSIGYLNKEELTQEKFIPNPFDKERKTKVYRTGDLVKLNSTMQIEFLGRIDNQVKIRGFRIELGEIENAIKKNDFISDCVAVVKEVSEADKRIIVFYSTYNNSGDSSKLEANQFVEKWKENYDNIYENAIKNKKQKGKDDLEIGYLVVEQFEQDKSYKDQYNVWINETTERIRKLKHNRVLEIGCGGGDILKRIISECDFYCATDLSPKVIEHLEKEIKNLDVKKPEVKLFALPADADLPFKYDFDTIIMNSVTAYFPNEEYLSIVIRKLTIHLSENGCFFIGDVQNFSLLKNLNVFELLNRTSSNVKINEFNKIVANKVRMAPEFFVDPDYFYLLPSINPSITRVEVKLLKGSLDNDPSTYHYDVFIYTGNEKQLCDNIMTINWKNNINKSEKINKILKQDKPDMLYVKDIPNKRIRKRIQIEKLIENANEDELILDVIKSLKYEDHDVNPEEIWAMENELDYRIDLILPENSDQQHFDAVFISEKMDNNFTYPIRRINLSDDTHSRYCNEPYSAFNYENITTIIKEKLSASLPEYMRPSLYISLESFPLTPNQKIDRKALSEYEIPDFIHKQSNKKPETTTEKKLAIIWENLLGIIDIGVHENFFELGGHSILAAQMFIEFEKETGKRIPLATLFTAQTIRQLAKIIDSNETELRWSPLVEIKKGDHELAPLFLVHGAEGNVLIYRDLANHLNSNLPVYGLQASGLNGKDFIVNNIEDMARDYIDAIKKVQFKGPYNLGGYCMGGTIAYEIAQQLIKRGDEVKNLFLIEAYNVCITPDTHGSGGSTREKIENFKFHFDNIITLSTSNKVKFISKKVEVLKRRIIAKFNSIFDKIGITVKDDPGTSKATYIVRDINDKAQAEYIPKIYKGKAVLLKPNVSYSSEPDPNFGWNKFVTGEFKVYNLNLAPRGMLVEPYAKETAAIITKEIQAK